MIGYNTLGTNGRLGNQMFQYASLRGIADKHGYDFCIPPEDHPTYADYALFLAKPSRLQGYSSVWRTPCLAASPKNNATNKVLRLAIWHLALR